MGKRVLADKKIKLTILTTKPADETAPTDASQLPQIMPAPSGH